MRLPRRVPWASLAELDEVASWIFTDATDISSKWLAIHRLSAWNQITPLPHALDATLTLLTILVQDPPASSQQPGQPTLSHLHIRLAYSAALIRLVNGLVDPLQQGVYARPIAAIAAQLGLPGWLVELRHGATHEELPSIDVLREGARQSMSWLYANYFLPLLAPASVGSSSTAGRASLRPLDPLLKSFKTLQKQLVRDASLRKTLAPDIARTLRDVERWVAEARIDAAVVDGVGLDLVPDRSGEETDDVDIDPQERWALERLCDALLKRGALIPQSKKKRAPTIAPFAPSAALVTLWEPLLSHLRSLHRSFPEILSTKLVAKLSSPPTSNADIENVAPADPSYDVCIAAWTAWIVDSWGSPNGDDAAARSGFVSRREVIIALISSPGPLADRTSKAIQMLLSSLTSSQPELAAAISALTQKVLGATESWDDATLDVMADRLQALSSTPDAVDEDTSMDDNQSVVSEPLVSTGLPAGWRLMDERSWRPAPIGVCVTPA